MRKSQPVNRSNLTEGVIWKQILQFFFPIMLGTLFQQLYNTVDAVVIGKYAGTTALASVGGSASQIINLLIGFFVGLSSGASVIVSQFFGAKNDSAVYKSIQTAMALAIFAGFFMTVAGIILSPFMLSLMNTPSETMQGSTLYMRIIFLAMIPSMIYNVGSGVLRALGDSRRPLHFLIVACLVNVVLDLLFVAVFRLGVLGVATATAIAQTISALLIWRCLSHVIGTRGLSIRHMRIDRDILLHTIQIGLPTGLQSVMYSVSNMIITTTINSFGTATVAAWVALGKVDGMYWMINSAYGASVMTFVGQNYGAHKLDRAEESMFVCSGLSVVSAWLFSLVFYTFAAPIFSLFTDDPVVMGYALRMVHSITPWYFLFVPIEMVAGSMRGMGDTLFPTVLTALGICVFRSAWMFTVIPRWHEIEAITISYPISWIITSIAFVLYYLYRRKSLGFPPFALRQHTR
ncbi:MAG: MATE family efflux transporter [Clostridia bacterium]|nr:MATE family efflux transporter [Clostridia bacterium]